MTSISDKEFYHLTISVNKALNGVEAPLKIKHARSIIIRTHLTKEAKSFWAVVTRQPLMENRFTAWKFCHLLHKVLREGHQSTLKHSQTHKKMILEMGKLWGHLQDGVGNCIQAYSKLIVTKLDFHEKNVIFPGSLIIDFRDIERYSGDDVNAYFQLCVEIFDYLDDIIDVQLKVFASINTYRMSSMTPQGQCRLAPLITLIQDSNPLYDLCVRLMFKLHDELPSDILAGHRDRFGDLFFKLKYFYDNVRPLQYFADLIQVPHLPEAAPNFTSKVDFGSYIPPVVFVQPEPEPAMDTLVDTSMEEQTASSEALNMSPQSDEVATLEHTIRDRELTIQGLENELANIRETISIKENSYKRETHQLRNEITSLANELASSKEMVANLSALKDDLEQKVANTPILIQKATTEEEKAKTSEEKFNKLKVMYTQIRDEHINLLRQHGESAKLLNKEKSSNAQLTAEIEELKSRISEVECDEHKFRMIENEKYDMQTKFYNVSELYASLMDAHHSLKRDYENLDNARSDEASELTAHSLKLQQYTSELEECQTKIADLEKSLSETQTALQKKTEELQATAERYKIDLESATETMAEMKKIQEKEIQTKVEQISAMEVHHASKDTINEAQLKEKDMSLNRLSDEKVSLENELQDILQQNSELEIKLKSTLAEVESITSAGRETEIRYESCITSLLHCVLMTMESTITSKCEESNQPNFEKALTMLNDTEKILNEISFVYQQRTENHNCTEGVARKAILLGYYFTVLHEQCLLIYNTTTDIEKGEEIFNLINSLRDPLVGLFKQLQGTGDVARIEQSVTDIKAKLCEINKTIAELMKALNTNHDVGDLVENELAEMDQAINEAAERFVELLSNARSQDNGIKLEVNEKILDACTALMGCIKNLIRKSKSLQEEIVSTGRGSTSVKEFYKRNSQWTEGLISASKSVAKGANLLVEAADKAVTSESGKIFEIIVAAQEIAACTAQLVIASKVKAPTETAKLSDLTKASRSVSQATGAVVATVKDCSRHLEQSQEVDLTKLTASQAKTMEMEIQVKVLELEQALQLERLRLTSFRRNHYQNTED